MNDYSSNSSLPYKLLIVENTTTLMNEIIVPK